MYIESGIISCLIILSNKETKLILFPSNNHIWFQAKKLITGSGDLFNFLLYHRGTSLVLTDFHYQKMKQKWPIRQARLSSVTRGWWMHIVPKKRHASTQCSQPQKPSNCLYHIIQSWPSALVSPAPVFPVTLSWPERSQDSSLQLVSLQTQSASSLAQTEGSLGRERGQGVFVMCWKESRLSLKAHWGPFIFPDAEWNFSGLGFWRGPWEWFVYGYGIDKEQRITSKPSVLSAKPCCGLHIQVPGRRSTSANTVWVPHRNTRPGNKEPGGQGLNSTTAVISVVWPSLVLGCGTRNQSITDTWAVCPECFVFQSLGCPLQVLY